ncbi:MAG TPA: hypothetical protein VIT23_07895 [Terrimicrobiaceae bacterium]
MSGAGGDACTFRVAVALVHGFALQTTEAMEVMKEYNSRCEPEWSYKELTHKITSAANLTRPSKSRGYLLNQIKLSRGYLPKDAKPDDITRWKWYISPRPLAQVIPW